MVAAASMPVPATEPMREGRVLLSKVPWSTYVVLRDTVAHGRMTYFQGWLEIMSPSPEHEVSTKQIARLLELFCLERGIPLYGYRSTTYRNEEEGGGLEADECYARGEDKRLPDVALEVVVSSPLLDKLEVYRGLGIREVWVYRSGRFAIHALRDGTYAVIASSEVLPEVDLEQLARHVAMPDHAALVAFRDELRAENRS